MPVTLPSAGDHLVTGTDSTKTGTATLTVTHGVATHFSVTAFDDPVVAGTLAPLDVAALDDFNNTDTNYAGTVHLTTTDPTGTVSGDASLTFGNGTFSATLFTAGIQSITATDTLTR